MCVELHIKTQIRIYLHTYIIIYLYDQKILSTYLIFIKCAGVYTFLYGLQMGKRANCDGTWAT